MFLIFLFFLTIIAMGARSNMLYLFTILLWGAFIIN
jgi:hypothetical protein